MQQGESDFEFGSSKKHIVVIAPRKERQAMASKEGFV